MCITLPIFIAQLLSTPHKVYDKISQNLTEHDALQLTVVPSIFVVWISRISYYTLHLSACIASYTNLQSIKLHEDDEVSDLNQMICGNRHRQTWD